MEGKSIIRILLGVVIAIGGCSTNNNLEWHDEDGYQWAEVTTDYFGSTGFEKLNASQTNIDFKNDPSNQSIRENRNFLNGSGVTTADVDGDGLVDIYFARLEGSNKLYKNLGGFKFKDITTEAGVAHQGYHSTGVVFADVNGDAHPDLLITSLNKTNELYINDGKGRFSLKENSGLGAANGSNTMALADIDSDGDLDLYITNYKLRSARDIFSAQELSTENTVKKQGDSLVVVPPFDEYYGIIKTDGRSYRNEYGARDELYLNKGNGIFDKVQNDKAAFLNYDGSQQGLSRDWGLTAKFQDINGDNLPDLYVANDFWTPDRVWINNGNGTFKSIESMAIRNFSFSAMGVDFSDINRDGTVDIFVSEMLSANHQRRLRQLSEYLDPIDGRPQYNRNSLYLGRGDNTYAQIASYSNAAATEWSWATNFLDIDLDGYEDLIITTGHGYDYQDIDMQVKMNRLSAQNVNQDIVDYPRLAIPNIILQNNGDLTFSDKSAEWGFNQDDVSLGMAMADFDNDGDADIVINRLNNPATIFENTTNASRIAVRLKGNTSNTEAIGAKIILEGTGVTQQKEISAGGSYVSGSQPMAFFAADESNLTHTLRVLWPDGSKSEIDSVAANRIYSISQSAAVPSADEKKVAVHSEFADVSNGVDYLHHEDAHTDTNVQPLLPIYLSRQGPGIAWIDYDQDGDDDLFIASGKGGEPGFFENTGNSDFNRILLNEAGEGAPGDQTSIIGWQENGTTTLIVGNANFETGDPNVPSAKVYTVNNGSLRIKQELPGILSTTGPLSAADYDLDGDIDLFVGGAFVPGEYPRNATSRLFKNENGRFILDETNSQQLEGIGLVSGSVFSDIDSDGDQDLLLARSWDSILLFENRNGQFVNKTRERGLHEMSGWWNGITTGDYNNDGRPDIVATNIGENSIYKPMKDHPLKLFYLDYDINGTLDIIDSYYNKELGAYVPRHGLFKFKSLPSLFRMVDSHEEFAQSSVTEIFGQEASSLPSKSINTVKHILYINQGDRFKAIPLPKEAQLSAAFSPVVADLNNDGNEDLFISQNLFTFPDNVPRLDAGRGLLLTGDGNGNFQVMKGQDSGIRVYGDQRGAAVSDFNNDRRVDVVITQNKSSTKLYQNRTDRQGIAIRLIGPESNYNAIGSGVQIIYENGSRGPWREIQAGSGYWSQNSFKQILGMSGDPLKVNIRWFDGSTDMVDLANGKSEYEIFYQ